MIKQFDNFIFSGVINYNDPAIAELADNIYEKVRQSGILPEYVKRNKSIRSFYDVTNVGSSSPIFVKDDRFTFGYAYCGEQLDIKTGAIVNLGVYWKVEFELYVGDEPNSIELLDGEIEIDSSLNIIILGETFTSTGISRTELNKITITRNHNSINVKVNEGYDNTLTSSTNPDTQFTTLFYCPI